MLMRLFLLIAPFLCLTSALHAQRRIILFIGDGVGASYWTAARYSTTTPLAVAQFKVMGLVDTRASNSLITDSGAAATAYSAGVRTYYTAIGVGPDSQPVETVLEAAKKQGWATGLVATSSITHATPAAFAAHVKSRASEFEIARQMADLRPDVMLGSGMRFFAPTSRPDRDDLISRLDSTHTVVTNAESFNALRDTTLLRLVGLFGDTAMPPAASRTPTLAAMTGKAIDVLSRDREGFFLVVEGSQPDWRGHDNQPVQSVIDEVLDFDAAIGVALAYQRRVPDVLIVVVADHETGGLAIHTARDSAVLAAAANQLNVSLRGIEFAKPLLTSTAQAESTMLRVHSLSNDLRAASRGARTDRLFADYTTVGHTGEMVPLFASGPGSDAFGGMIDNYRVGQILLEIVRRPATPPRRRRE